MKKGVQPKTTPGRGLFTPPRNLSPGSPLSDPRSRSPSPSSRPQTPGTFPRVLGQSSSQQLDVTEDSEHGAVTEQQRSKGAGPGVRYITEDLIKKLTKQDNLALVQSVNLSLAKGGGKKFKYIENFEKCERLQVLHLSNNLIEKIEKLDKQHRLQELHLAHNKISKIENLEHMASLTYLNLAGNDIEHVPAWVGKKLQAIRNLNLKQNRISSLQDIARLKPLKDLTTLALAENPIASLPHYRPFIVFHLRSVERLDGQPITDQERQQAHERFHLEEVERLEQELEKRLREIEDLKEEQAMALEELGQQEELNKSLQQETQERKHSHQELGRELDTKNQLLKQKTAELTRACQKQYELEQELAFYKIDAKFEPLAFYPDEDLELENSPGESPYIGKAKYKRNAYAAESFLPEGRQQARGGRMEMDLAGEAQSRLQETLLESAEERLKQLQKEIGSAEQQILRATSELKQLEEAVSQKRISEAEKEQLRQQLHRKIQLLNQLKQEAQELERQMERQRAEMSRKQGELDELQRALDSMDPNNPKHAHVKAQVASKSQQLDMMSNQYRDLENRLDEMLSRIAKETEEIKDLEQQLTEGQIAANEALKRDLEGIISGLQEYLNSVKGQARHAQEKCMELQREREALHHRLAELEEERNQLEIVAMDAENVTQELSELQCSMQELQRENETLRQAQGDLSAYEAELEAQLQDRDTEANQLKEELGRLRRLSQMEQSALKSELEKERQALENAMAQAQLASEREQENKEMLSQLERLQGDNHSLKEKLQNLQNQLDQERETMLRPKEVTSRIGELQRKLKSGVGEIRPYNAEDSVGRSLAELQQEIRQILSRTEREKEEAVQRQDKLTHEMAALREKLRKAQDDYKAACDEAAEARIDSEKRECAARVRQVEKELRRVQGKLQSMEDVQALAEQQLQEAKDERHKLLAELEERDSKINLEDSRTQMQLQGLDKELRDLKGAMAAADKMAARQLCEAKDQLRSLHGTVCKLNQERAEELNELEGFRAQAARAARAAQDLNRAEAEIDLLQKLLKDKEKQMLEEVDRTEAGAHNTQQQELDRQSRTLGRQRAETKRLRGLLSQAKEDNAGEMESLMDEIRALRDSLAQQNAYVSSLTDSVRRRGHWYYVSSPPNAPSTGSQGTRDSGLGSQYPASPSRGQSQSRRERKREREEPAAPPTGGYWIYSPVRNGPWRTHSRRAGGDVDSGGESDCSVSSVSARPFIPPPGSVIYTVLPDGAPLPQGTVIYGPPPPQGSGTAVSPGAVIYGPPPMGAQLVYGPPPTNFSVPLIPAGVLHCNVPDHHELENEVSRLESLVAELRRQRREEERQGGSAQRQQLLEVERLHCEIQTLQRERDMLEHEAEVLRRAGPRHHKHKDLLDGTLGSLVTELEMETSLRQHGDIVDEIECVEKTLLKRRAELREADRLLMEAESELKSTQVRTEDTIQQYSDAKRHLANTEKDAEELENRAQETATELVKANQQLRIVQADLQELEQHKIEQQGILQEINAVVSSRDSDFQALNHKIHNITESLEKLHAELQLAESKEEKHVEALREAERLLSSRRSELEKLNNEVHLQQEEVMLLDRRLGKKKEEERLLQESVEHRRASLAGVLREGEGEVLEKQRQIKELTVDLEDLSAQKGELSAQLSEKRSQLCLLKQEVLREEESLQSALSQINKHKAELKHVLEMLQLEDNELQGVRIQHDQKMNELEKTQVALLQGKVELQALEQAAQRQRAEGERHAQRLEKERQELEGLRQEAHSLQDSIDSLRKDKSQLEEKCHSTAGKLAQSKRALTDTEESCRAALSTLEGLESEVSQVRQDLSQGTSLRQELCRETTAIQQQLQEKTEELTLLKDDLHDTREQLNLVEEKK
ncbi:centriolin isoform X5 [Polyodon spathula]|uniref:centriolin isoform X5 n=1 Tax=Polyodon spathula TaxID=7913 RepID=UPI001B7E979A|nr:centriolin isoform X5 [Polyodon spathula]